MPRCNAECAPVILDDGDAHLAQTYRWCDNGDGYAKAYDRKTKRFVYLHRIVTQAQRGQIVDHINGNRMDCRRANLRITDRSGNALNSRKRRCHGAHGVASKYRGVAWHPTRSKWVANYRGKYLGLFDNDTDAARAYNAAADRENNEFARRNAVEAMKCPQ